MAFSHAFQAHAGNKAKARNLRWFQENITKVLEACKEKQVREIDASISMAEELLKILDEPVAKHVEVPTRDVIPYEDDSLMTPIEPEVLDLLYKSTEKGAAEKYFKARNKKSPEDKFFFRISSNWDYGWQQKQSRVRARDVNRGRCAILRDTFYRKNNLAPDPVHYAQPAGGEVGICSEYSCFFN